MSETARVRAFIFTTLTNDPTLAGLIGNRAYHGVAPAQAQYPFVVFQMLSAGNDLMTVGTARIWSAPLFIVKAVCKGSSTDPVEPVANRIDQLLHAAAGTVTNGVIWECVRERPFDLPTNENGVFYQQLGGEYRFLASQV